MKPLSRILSLLGLCLLICGCGGKEESEPSATDAGGAPRQGVAQKIRGRVEDVQTLARLKNLGLTFQLALTGGARTPNSFDDLLEYTEKVPGMFLSARDKQQFEVAWGVNLNNLDNKTTTILAWEKTPSSDGGRCVLMADCSIAQYLSKEDFAKTPKANGR